MNLPQEKHKKSPKINNKGDIQKLSTPCKKEIALGLDFSLRKLDKDNYLFILVRCLGDLENVCELICLIKKKVTKFHCNYFALKHSDLFLGEFARKHFLFRFNTSKFSKFLIFSISYTIFSCNLLS